ncbi:peptidase M15 family [Acinetobacter baumannii]|uniref:D-Ala-D-Ala carboxypeptidase ZrlA n=1 Tax=Acinetobacter baumannii TaxID=470 RepID=UPI0002981C73|nr:D-Ala-D-Ala carboxypeptidase family metallohydrolase [Acinetobacter baumannii]EKP68612.1 peptidase M15 [Acinetobacter baumannii OIFC035]TPU54974.1 peptidase M15 [Acinetobacter baumannii]SSV55044.1 peptidase M15 family [Acinetobacter baumannii]SSV85615.1 peptidase M15 family [Acinetobacter baumannii]SSV90105.1 peptidase M15 family [Acinetobacter baumannii]
MKRYLGLLVLTLAACSTQTPQPTITHRSPTLPQPSKTVVKIKQQPEDYIVWIATADHRQSVQAYKQFLKQKGLADLVPDHELLRSARDWQKCGVEPYAVPPREIWSNIVPTLNILKALVDDSVINDFEVTSVYRALALNRCAGGADASRHVFNAALDFRIGPEQPSDLDQFNIQQTKTKLCQFWETKGQALNMGLGVYASGQIHIDSQGFRSWGPDHHYRTSICQGL